MDDDHAHAGYSGNILDKETAFQYDHLDRQIARILPLAQVESHHYDDTPLSGVGGSLSASTALGQLAFSVDFEGNVTAYLYDNTATRRVADGLSRSVITTPRTSKMRS